MAYRGHGEPAGGYGEGSGHRGSGGDHTGRERRSRSRSRERGGAPIRGGNEPYYRGGGRDNDGFNRGGGAGSYRREYADKDDMGMSSSLVPPSIHAPAATARPYSVGPDATRMLANSIAQATGDSYRAATKRPRPHGSGHGDDRFADDEDDDDDDDRRGGHGGEKRGRFDDHDNDDAEDSRHGKRSDAPLVDPVAAPLELPEGMDEEAAMAAIMGFSSFDTTHGKKIEDNHKTAAKGACAKVFTKSLEWRQYMHRGKALGQRANLEGKIVSRRVNGSGVHIDTSHHHQGQGGGAGKKRE